MAVACTVERMKSPLEYGDVGEVHALGRGEGGKG